jgi:hypothetical protein
MGVAGVVHTATMKSPKEAASSSGVLPASAS